MTALAQKHQAINLGQGFPDFDGPDWIKKLASEAIQNGHNQYAHTHGVVALRDALSALYRQRYQLHYDATSDITVTAGATEAIFCTILAICNPGDEVVVFEPFYDSYIAAIELAGAIIRPVTLEIERGFSFDPAKLAQAVGPRTKLIIVNTPHNPTGRVFSIDELNQVAAVALKHDCFILSDEVYEYLIYPGQKHIPIATLPQMQDRTITISSSGKTFGLTGWKIGWTCAPKTVSNAIRMVHQFTTFCVATPLQVAMAKALTEISHYLPSFQKEYLAKRDYFVQSLQSMGLKPYIPQGTYFVLLPIEELTKKDDINFCMELIENDKVAAIPPSAFYMSSNEGKRIIRFCFAKKQETLDAAIGNLKKRFKVY
jgi:N-succinyldiaminopimelate aminotransferase